MKRNWLQIWTQTSAPIRPFILVSIQHFFPVCLDYLYFCDLESNWSRIFTNFPRMCTKVLLPIYPYAYYYIFYRIHALLCITSILPEFPLWGYVKIGGSLSVLKGFYWFLNSDFLRWGMFVNLERHTLPHQKVLQKLWYLSWSSKNYELVTCVLRSYLKHPCDLQWLVMNVQGADKIKFFGDALIVYHCSWKT